jgi:hypothetical protein
MGYYSSATIIAWCSTLAFAALFSTAARFWVRLRYAPQPLAADDWLMVMSAVVAVACAGIQVYSTVHGLAGEPAYGHTERAVIEHKLDFALVVIEKFAFGGVKLSLLFFFRRYFGVWTGFRRINNVLIVVVAAWALAFLLGNVFICGANVPYYWALDQQMARARCGNLGL